MINKKTIVQLLDTGERGVVLSFLMAMDNTVVAVIELENGHIVKKSISEIIAPDRFVDITKASKETW